MKWIARCVLIAKKDLAIERATGEIVTTLASLAVLLTVLSSLAFSNTAPTCVARRARSHLAFVTFASVLGLGRTWTREREEGALRGLIVSPISRSAIFAGKALGVIAVHHCIELLVIPVSAVLLGFDLGRYVAPLAVIALLRQCGDRGHRHPLRCHDRANQGA